MERSDIITATMSERTAAPQRAVSRLECEMVLLNFFEIPFQPRFLLQELIFLSSKMDSWLHETEWPALRTMDRCDEHAVLPLLDLQVFRSGLEMVETEESSASLGFAPSHPEIPACRMESMGQHRAGRKVQRFLFGSRRYYDNARIQIL